MASGKSTLTLFFFQFVEVTEGKILVDRVDLSKVGLMGLCSKLSEFSISSDHEQMQIEFMAVIPCYFFHLN